jgi:hypothetical protein
VGRLTSFELDNFDNYVPSSSNIESSFNAKLSLGKKGKKKIKQEESEDESSEEDLEIVEAYLARKFRKGKGKYKGKIPLIFFSCDEVGHIATRCPNKDDDEEKEDKKPNKYKEKKDFKYFKNKKKSCYLVKEEESEADDELVYIAVKDDSDDDKEKTTLISHISDTWIIDSGCSHHMIGDRSKFEKMEKYNGGSVRFGNNDPCLIKGKGTITLSNGIKCDNAYWVEGLRHNLLSVAQLTNIGFQIEFLDRKVRLLDRGGRLVGIGTQTKGNLFYLNLSEGQCLLA